jgi:hypothetical protein
MTGPQINRTIHVTCQDSGSVPWPAANYSINVDANYTVKAPCDMAPIPQLRASATVLIGNPPRFTIPNVTPSPICASTPNVTFGINIGIADNGPGNINYTAMLDGSSCIASEFLIHQLLLGLQNSVACA